MHHSSMPSACTENSFIRIDNRNQYQTHISRWSDRELATADQRGDPPTLVFLLPHNPALAAYPPDSRSMADDRAYAALEQMCLGHRCLDMYSWAGSLADKRLQQLNDRACGELCRRVRLQAVSPAASPQLLVDAPRERRAPPGGAAAATDDDMRRQRVRSGEVAVPAQPSATATPGGASTSQGIMQGAQSAMRAAAARWSSGKSSDGATPRRDASLEMPLSQRNGRGGQHSNGNAAGAQTPRMGWDRRGAPPNGGASTAGSTARPAHASSWFEPAALGRSGDVADMHEPQHQSWDGGEAPEASLGRSIADVAMVTPRAGGTPTIARARRVVAPQACPEEGHPDRALVAPHAMAS